MPEPNKGHSTETPKLIGTAVSSLLPSFCDIMIDIDLNVGIPLTQNEQVSEKIKVTLIKYLLHIYR